MSAYADLTAPWQARFDPVQTDMSADKPVIGYIANTTPVEMILAAGCEARQVTGNPTDDPKDALTRMEPFLDGAVLSIFQRWLDGRLDHLTALIIPRSCEGYLQLYYHMVEENRTAPKAGRPTPILFDILHTPFPATARYNAGRLTRLRERLDEITGRTITDNDLSDAIAATDKTRILLAQINALRCADTPRLTGAQMLAITGASTQCAPHEFHALANAFLNETRSGQKNSPVARPPLPRVLITGSPQDEPGLHQVIEDIGAIVTGDDHAAGDWWFLDPIAPETSEASETPMQALLRKYHLNAPSLRSFPREHGDERLINAVERARPDAVIFVTEEWDDALGFDYPTQRDLLAQRGLPCLFLPNQSYRHPDRLDQAERIAAFLMGAEPTAPQKALGHRIEGALP